MITFSLSDLTIPASIMALYQPTNTNGRIEYACGPEKGGIMDGEAAMGVWCVWSSVTC